MRMVVLLCVLLLASCSTIEGIGRDLSKAGDAVSGAARDVKRAF